MRKRGKLRRALLACGLAAGLGARPAWAASSAAALAADTALPFTDVAPGDSFYEAVADVYRQGIMNGTGEGRFSPGESATRAMMATVFYRMEGSPHVGGGASFPDLPAGGWYTQAVQWAAEEKLYQGYDDGAFHPEESITREQLCAVLSRYAQYQGADTTSSYVGSERVRFSPWAAEACGWALERGLYPDDGGALNMTEPARRWEIAEVLHRYIQRGPTLRAEAYGGLACLLYEPAGAGAGMPLVVYLHGGSGRGNDLSLLTGEEGFPQYLSEGRLGEPPAYVLIPQLPAEKKGWADAAGEVAAMIEAVCAKYQLDTSRVALTGHSMGGTGTWALALAMPDKFSCIVPMSGSVRLSRENVDALSRLPVWAFVGEKDTIVDPASTLRFVEALQKSGGSARVTVLPGADHFSVPEGYLDEGYDLLSWMLSQAREG